VEASVRNQKRLFANEQLIRGDEISSTGGDVPANPTVAQVLEQNTHWGKSLFSFLFVIPQRGGGICCMTSL